jgi:hypothetical protein
VSDAALATSNALFGSTLVAVAAICVAVSSAALPWARRRSSYGVAAAGFALTAASVVAGASVAGTAVVFVVWAAAGVAAAAFRRA